jgi:hypothetical protein
MINVVKDSLNEAVKSLGGQGFLNMISESLDTNKAKPEDFSILELWNACTDNAPIEERNPDLDFRYMEASPLEEAIGGIGTSLFAKATGALINKKVRDAYDEVPAIGDKLVTVVPSSLKQETFVAFTAMDNIEEVRELEEYKSRGIGEIYFSITNHKYGGIIGVSEETVKMDQTGQILMRAAKIGEVARLYKEDLIVTAVIGPAVDSSTDSKFKPLGSPAVLYKSTARTTDAQGGVGGANGLTGYADINHAALQAVNALVAKQYSEGGSTRYVNLGGMMGWILLCPAELHDEAWEIVNTQKTPFSADNAENYWRQFQFVPRWTPFYDAATTTWIVGDFRKDFIYTEVFPLEVKRLARGSEIEFTRDMIAAYKVRFAGGIGAIDYRHSYKVE